MDVRRLIGPSGGRFQEGLGALETLRPDTGALLMQDRFTAETLKGLPTDVGDLIRAEAPDAFRSLLAGEQLPFRSRFALEVVARVEGRPSLPLIGGIPDLNSPEAVGWRGLLGDYKTQLAEVADAVGRIDLAGVHVGTGFLVAKDLVLTNRHVAEVIAKAYPRSGGDVWLMKAGAPWIDFAREIGGATTKRFQIVGVAAAGPDAINMQVNPKLLDAAVLRIEKQSMTGKDQPTPITFLAPESLANEEGGQIMSIGYPGTPGFEPKGPVPTADEQKLMAALKRIFNMTYGVKRISPGVIVSRAGRVPDGGKGWAFTHDASTLAGASGSAVVRLAGNDVRVMGLHFGGAWLEHNYAHLTMKLAHLMPPKPATSWKP